MKRIYILGMLAVLLSGILNAQIVQVTDINTTGDAGIGYPTLYNGEIFFEADDGSAVADELYKIAADGTVSLVKDINTDTLDSSPNSDPKWFIEYNGLLYFNGNDGDNGVDLHDTELWVTDGTPEGTRMAFDIWPGGAGNASNPMEFFIFNNKLYFQAKVESSVQIWRYDGVSDPVKITTFRDDGLSTPFFACVDEANGKAYFKVNNGKYQLGVLNADESSLLIQVHPTDHGFPGTEAGVIYKDKFYFDGDNATGGDELFISDGTPEGTIMLKDINVGGDSDPEQFTEYNGELYFIANATTGMQLWKTDGTADGTVMAAEPYVGGNADMDDLTLFNGKLYFSATDGVNGIEVWTYDGDTATMLKDLDGAATNSNPEGFTEVDGLLFFVAVDSNGKKLWVTDGSNGGTFPVDSLFVDTEVPLDITSSEFVVNGTKLYFTGDDANGDDIFMIDARSIKAVMNQVTDINKSGDSGIGYPTAYNGELFFEADDGSAVADELYKIAADGTVSLVKDINTDTLDSSPNGDPKWFIEYNGLLYFNANDGDNGADKHDNELWVTDGTTEGTQLAFDIWPGGAGNASNPMEFFIFNNKLYFQAKVETSVQIWRYDGVTDPVKITTFRDDGLSTPFFACVDEANGKAYFKVNNGKYQLGVLNADESSLLIQVHPTDHGFPGTEAGVIYKDKFYFDGDNGTGGDELFISDGTPEGTIMLKDINVGGDSDPEQFTEYNGELYFIANATTGMQLWKTDGTADGTVMAAEPYVGGNASMDYLTLYNGKLYFSATDGVNGIEVWTYDGNAASMLKDLDGAATDSKPAGFIEVDGLLLFVADTGSGKKLWVTNGDADFTMTVADALNSTISPTNVDAAEFAVIGTVLYYSADDANGWDDIYSVDVKKIFSEDVTFTVSDENGVLAGATVEFDGTSATTDDMGKVTFEYVRMGTDLAYTVSMEDYQTASGTVNVADMPVFEDVVLLALPSYNVTFTVTDGTNPLEGAGISFNSTTGTTDASGVFTFTEVLPGNNMPYTITKAGYQDVSGTATVVDADVNINETMARIAFTVTFTVTDGTNPIEGAEIAFNGTNGLTNALGVYAFMEVVPGPDMAYTITKAGYADVTGTTTVVDADVNVSKTMTLIVYTVTFNISDGVNPIEGAIVTFYLQDKSTDASGSVVFTDVVPGTGFPYAVTVDYRYYDDNGTVDVDGDEVVNVTLAPTSTGPDAVSTLNVYPNPTKGTIYMDGVDEHAAYELYNINQQKIAEGILDGSRLDLNISTGIYFLKVTDDQDTFVQKLIVH